MSADNPGGGDRHGDKPQRPEQPPGNQHGEAAVPRPPAETRTMADLARERHAKSPIQPDSPAAERAAPPSHGRGSLSCEKQPQSEHHPGGRSVIVHYHAEFNGRPTDLYTDGTRWASGDMRRREDTIASKGEAPPDRPPNGEELVDSAGEESSVKDRILREVWEDGDDVVDMFQNNIDDVHDIFTPPPTGSHEGTPTAGPYYSSQHNSGIDVGTSATALLAFGLAVERGAQWIVEHWERRSEGDD